jgi:predicted metalloprotease
MRWTPGGPSNNLEDRRGEGGGGFRFGGGAGRLGIGGFVVLLILSVVFKQDFFSLIGASGEAPAATGTAPPQPSSPGEEREVQFVSFVLDDAQQTWPSVLDRAGAHYRDAKLVLFRDGIESACGLAQSATGPFYCPGDEKVYLDLAFFDELSQRFHAAGEFAQAYVIAHEIGHHVQKILGTEAQVRRAQRANPQSENPLSVRLELQADCYAGVWGHSTAQRNILESGDVEAGLNAAAAVGDDRIQRMATGHINPDGFTHGTSAQRVAWFKKGLDTGDLAACNTFADLSR